MQISESKNEGRKVRWGILGTGKIARIFASALMDIPQAQLVAVGSRNKLNASLFGRAFGVDSSRCYSSYEELAHDSQIEVIYVATPHIFHAKNSLMCLKAGKNVLCEKPFALNLREAEQVINVAKQKHLFIMEAMWTRFLPAIIEAKNIITSGTIGKVQHIQSDFGFIGDTAPEHRLNNKELGGGALLDIGVYCLSISTFFLGAVDEVKAISRIGTTKVDEQTSFLLRHKNGGISSSMCSIRISTNGGMNIIGDLGVLSIPFRFYRADKFTLSLNNGNSISQEYPYQGDGYIHEAIEVMRCIYNKKIESPTMPHAEMLEQIEVLDAIRKQIGLSYSCDS
ncbi:Gfo/Idh/MocA family protein [Undibacterium curvum]|uniref:Gfo/Idh/MocA family oxidoreductase n=1 Tax=Undibacterium curvum TaxID=2762294 RepID=A0ABR7A104_9BURK|nr:Gfo/Idh/MocA family oxidoreductase [Undibacterium curvum]MBC3930589.1 Gfo/Idh/MocA family oxidoreductase [Undibacterium curvum]